MLYCANSIYSSYCILFTIPYKLSIVLSNVNLMDIVFLKNQKSAKNGIRKPLQVNLGKYDELAVAIARSYTQTFFLCVFTEETSYPLGTSQQALQTFVQVDARKLWLCEDCFCLIFFHFVMK